MVRVGFVEPSSHRYVPVFVGVRVRVWSWHTFSLCSTGGAVQSFTTTGNVSVVTSSAVFISAPK